MVSSKCLEHEVQVEEIQGGTERRAVCGWLLPERGKSKALLPRLLRKNMKTPDSLSSTMKWMEIREASHLQNGWIFGKVPNGLWSPPPHFRKVTLRLSRQNCDKSAYVHMEEHLCILWSYFPWDACSTNVQHGNRVKTYPKETFLYHFHAEKALFKGPNFET